MADEKPTEWTATNEVAPGFERNRATGPTAGEWSISVPGRAPQSLTAAPDDKYRAAAIAERDKMIAAGIPGQEGYGSRLARAAGMGWTDEVIAAGMTPFEMLKRRVGPVEAYRYAKARETLSDDAMRENTRGVLGEATEAAGGLASAGGLLNAAGTRAAGYGANIAKGAGIGAFGGAGAAPDLKSIPIHAGMGGILGAGMSAAAPVAGNIGGAVYRGMADRGVFGGLPSAVVKAGQADAAGVARVAQTPGAMLPDAGPSMLGTAQGAILGTGGPGKTALTTNLRTRDEGTSGRVLAELDRGFGPAPTPSHLDAQIAQRMEAMSPAYEAALQRARAVDPEPVALWLHGRVGTTAGPGQRAYQEMLRELEIPNNPGVLNPDPLRMQAIRTSIRNQIRDPKIDPDRRVALEAVDQRLTQELQDKVPGIRALDHAYAELGTQRRAVGYDSASAGKDIFDSGKNAVWRPVELAETMTAGAQPKGVNIGPSAEPFRLRQAARAEMDRIVGNAPNDLRKLETLLGEPHDWNSQKLAIMFGQERADALRAVMNRERNARSSFQELVQGPETAQRLVSAKALDAGEGKIPVNTTMFGTVTRALQEGVDAARGAINRGSRDRIAALMATQDPVELQRLANRILQTGPQRDATQAAVRDHITRVLQATPATAPALVDAYYQ
jgi:hypothetical protein